MAQVTGPLLSIKARGTIANTITYANWKGIDYARTRVIPANPRSTAQTNTREVFTFIQELYKRLPAIGREPWIASVVGNPMTPQNMILKKNVATLREDTDLLLFDFSPGARGGPPPTAVEATAGAGQVSIAVTAPSAPPGWTITAAQGVAIRDQDPHDAIVAAPSAAEDTTSAYAVVITGLTAAELYVCGAWLKWLTPTGDAAYSIALTDTATPS